MRLSVMVLVLALAVSGVSRADSGGPQTIVGGALTAEGEWLDAVAIYAGEFVCSGALVAPTVVLTAGHCIGGITDVRIGFTSLDSGTGEVIPIIQEVVHPGFDPWTLQHDIGLVILSRPSVFPPRTIATGCALSELLMDGAEATIVGYGAVDEQGVLFTGEQRAAPTQINDASCSKTLGCATLDGEVSAGGGGVDTCYGDSGGPLYLLSEPRAYLVGLTSRGYPDAVVPCAGGGIYTRPDYYIEWIESQVGAILPRTTCRLLSQTIDVETGTSKVFTADLGPLGFSAVDRVVVVDSPQFGAVTSADDAVAYQPDDSYPGEDAFTVEVLSTDSPSESALAVITLRDDGCGCRTGRQSSPVDVWWVVLVAVALGRRRRSPHGNRGAR